VTVLTAITAGSLKAVDYGFQPRLASVPWIGR
jgi:hypothetical protein